MLYARMQYGICIYCLHPLISCDKVLTESGGIYVNQLETKHHEHTYSIEPATLHFLLRVVELITHGTNQKLDEVLTQLTRIQRTEGKIKMNQTEELALLKDIDSNTTLVGANVQKVADNVQVIATTAGTISTEMDDLLAKVTAGNGEVTPEVVNQLTSMRDRMTGLATASQSSSDALDQQVPVLNAIATKGAAQPIPIPVPAPPPDVVLSKKK